MKFWNIFKSSMRKVTEQEFWRTECQVARRSTAELMSLMHVITESQKAGKSLEIKYYIVTLANERGRIWTEGWSILENDSIPAHFAHRHRLLHGDLALLNFWEVHKDMCMKVKFTTDTRAHIKVCGVAE